MQSLGESVGKRCLSLLLLLLWLIVLVQCRLHLFFDSDGVNYGLALRHYDLSLFQPHPLGDPLYVLLAKFFSLFHLDAVTALWLVSFLGYGLILVLAQLSGASLGGLFLLATSPLLVKHALVVNPDIWEGGLFLAAFLLAEPRREKPLLLALFGLALSFRLTLFFYLSLYFAFLVWKWSREKDFAKLFSFALGIALWLLPFLAVVGVSSYGQALFQRQEQFTLSLFGSGLSALFRNISCLSTGILFGLGAALPLLLASGKEFALKRGTLFLLLFPIGSYLLLILCNTSAYLLGPTVLFLYLTGEALKGKPYVYLPAALLNLFLLTGVVFPTLHRAEREWKREIACVERRFSPQKSLLFFEFSYGQRAPFFYRHALYYLPSYATLYLRKGDPKKWWWGERGEVGRFRRLPRRKVAHFSEVVSLGKGEKGGGSCGELSFQVEKSQRWLAQWQDLP